MGMITPRGGEAGPELARLSDINASHHPPALNITAAEMRSWVYKMEGRAVQAMTPPGRSSC
jgi:hypothetical protein